RRMYPTKQVAVAEMRMKLEQTRALFLRAAGEARVDPTKDERLRCYAAHYTIMENANDIARLAIRTCRGQSMLKNLALERIYRDSRCGSLMLPWTAELCVDRIGREALYEAGEADDQSARDRRITSGSGSAPRPGADGTASSPATGSSAASKSFASARR